MASRRTTSARLRPTSPKRSATEYPDAVRAANRRPAAEPLAEDHTASGASPLEEAVGQQTLNGYRAALDRLSSLERDLVLARVELGLPYAHVAELLSKSSPSAARMATSRALVRLAGEMSRDRGR